MLQQLLVGCSGLYGAAYLVMPLQYFQKVTMNSGNEFKIPIWLLEILLEKEVMK